MARVLIRCALAIAILAAAADAAAYPVNSPAFAGDHGCSGEWTAFADIDGNGVVDRIDSRDRESAAAEILVTLNGTRQVHLPEPVPACDLVLIDFDDDTDIDLIGFTAGGQLLVWRNDGGVLGLVHSRLPASRFPCGWEPRTGAGAPSSFGLRERSMGCDVTAESAAVAVQTAVVALSSTPNTHSSSYAPSAPRAPPAR